MQLRLKYDEAMHAFYTDASLHTLFKIAHRSLLVENMYLQLGRSFPATDERVFAQRL
jgi:hypothetical protein